jgi:hypothetical protein
MVRAILAGTKTQTRRIVSPQPDHHWSSLPGYRLAMDPQVVGGCFAIRPTHSIPTRPFADESSRVYDFEPWVLCRQGAPGDRLWVRETFLYVNKEAREVDYMATTKDGHGRWKPSIHMPRWASRITLEVTDVRIERLQTITEEDAVAEGMYRERGAVGQVVRPGPRDAFEALWESINGPGSWFANPWVWVVEFRMVP